MMSSELISNYLLSHLIHEPEIFAELRQWVVQNDLPNMHISAEQGHLMAFLAKLINAERILELGTYVGYSTLWLANALPEHGEVVTCDIDHQHQATAKLFWERANLIHKIKACVSPALIFLDELILNQEENKFDLIFIDADKQNYPSYFEKSLVLLSPRGLIILDNIFMGNRVFDLETKSISAQMMREFTKSLVHDKRVETSVLPIRDGVMLVRKI